MSLRWKKTFLKGEAGPDSVLSCGIVVSAVLSLGCCLSHEGGLEEFIVRMEELNENQNSLADKTGVSD